MSTVETDLENELRFWILQKQPPRDVLKKRCTGNMLQIYRRTPMPQCDFNKVASHFSMGVLLYISSTFAEHLFSRTPLGGCFWYFLILFCFLSIYRFFEDFYIFFLFEIIPFNKKCISYIIGKVKIKEAATQRCS